MEKKKKEPIALDDDLLEDVSGGKVIVISRKANDDDWSLNNIRGKRPKIVGTDPLS